MERNVSGVGLVIAPYHLDPAIHRQSRRFTGRPGLADARRRNPARQNGSERECELCATELLAANSSTLCKECALILANAEPNDERWKPVVGWEDHYEISDWGRVRRIVHQHRSGGYPAVTLSAPGQATKRVRVHLLVLEAFRGPRPYRCEALHGNDIAYDNRAVNLRWGSRRENLADRRRIIAERLRELQAACLGKELEA
jgi:hypothetical protein